MNQDEGGSSQKQGIQLFQPDRQISSTQKKRKTGIALIIAYVLIATGMIAYAFVESEEVEYHADNDLCTKMEQKQTPTETCYRREKNKNYPVFISYGLGLLGILLAPTVRCLCDFVEELCLSRSCDRRSIFKLFKLCFSGISWKAVSVVFLIDTIACVLAKNSFKLGDLMYILGGIGVFPLVAYLLNLNAQSEVNLSRRLEEKGLYPAYTIAWNYYLHYLKNALPIFSESFSDSDTQGSDRDPKIQLSLKKMILLFPYNGETKKDLVKQDSRFKKITDISEGGYNFPVYGLIFNGKEYKYVIQYAEEVLSTLRMMCIDERVKCIHEGDLEDQVKLLYRTLVSEILSKDDECRHNCILAQTTAENSSNGRLADVIMHNIRVNECVSTPNSKTVQQRETNDTSLSDTNTGPAVSDTLPAKHPHSNLWSQHRQPRRRKCYSFQELTSNNPPDGVDPSKLESYLIDDEFQKIFEMSRDLFSQLPGWKQDILKKAFGLF